MTDEDNELTIAGVENDTSSLDTDTNSVIDTEATNTPVDNNTLTTGSENNGLAEITMIMDNNANIDGI